MDTVEIVDVAPRDGLQNESTVLETSRKIELIDRIVRSGVRRIEATSFVHPQHVPALADAEDVMKMVTRRFDTSYIGLVLNDRGLERAIDAKCDEINCVVPATDTFSIKNQGVTVQEAVSAWHRIAERARGEGIAPSLVISTAFGCPYDGEVEHSRVVGIVEQLLEQTPERLTLADTIGVATPRDVQSLFGTIIPMLPTGVSIGAHFHNTRNTGLANAYAALQVGVRSFDASLGGIGGCPFAPNATGNVPTEDLVYMFDRMGLKHGLDLSSLSEGAAWLRTYLGSSVTGLYSKAGPFPRP